MTTKRALYEILKDLSSKELEDFNLHVELEKGAPLLSKDHAKGTNAEEVVELMVEKYREECVELTKNILKKMNRTDLVQRLSDSSAESKETKHWPSLIQRVEMRTSDIEVLMDMLADLNEEEIEYFRNVLKHTPIKIHESRVPWWQLIRTGVNTIFVDDHQDIVFLIIMTCGQLPVETTREVLNEMKRTDLVQRLSDTGSRSKNKESDEQSSALIQKVATMAAVKQLLLETLHCLNEGELYEIKRFLGLIVSRSSIRENVAKRVEIVDLMMRRYGQQSVEKTRGVLEKLDRTDLIQMLSESSSALKEKLSVDKHQPTLSEEAEKEDAEPSLLQTLKSLSLKELQKFMFLLNFTYFYRGLPQIPWIQTEPAHQLEDLVDLMVENQQPVEVMKEVLMDMNRSDLVEKLSGTSSGFTEKSPVDWLKTVETATSVTELLMETLADLSEEELEEFMTNLRHTWSFSYTFDSPWLKLEGRDHQETVFSVIMTCGKHSVEITREILHKMKRTDLMQRLSDTSSTPKNKESDEQSSALIQKVATMAAVKQLLLETLLCLSVRELHEFKRFLGLVVSSSMRRYRGGRAERAVIVDQIMTAYRQQSVELTRGVLEKMNRTDLIQMLSESSSALEEKHYVDKHQPTSLGEAEKEDAELILLQTLKSLSLKELQKFMFLLNLTYFHRGLPQIPWLQTEPAHQLEDLVDLMVENQQPVEVLKEVLMDMNRSDLVEKLSGTSSGLKTQKGIWSKRPQKESVLTADHEQLLEILEKLSPGDLEKFKHILQQTKLRGLPKIPGDIMEGADKAETVRLMVENYGQQSVEVTKDVLEMIKRMDLVEKLSESSSGSQGSLESEVCGSTATDSSPWTKLEPGVNSSGGNEFPTYSLQSETGNFECRVSGLRWVCKEGVSFQYHFCSWGGHMERMESMKYMPAGPLMDIKVITGRMNEVYLPHWICTEDDSKILDNFRVLHIDECGDVVENVSEVTPSHVKLSEPVFSPRGVLLMQSFLTGKVKCWVLIYYKPNTPFLKLRVYLVPRDPALRQTLDQAESLEGFKRIKKPRPGRSLKLKQRFSLTANIKTAEINPQEITLEYDYEDPNFYEVFIEKPNRNFQLALSYASTKEVQSEPVWTCEIRKDDHKNNISEDKPSVDDQLSEQMQAVTINTTERERLLKTLKELTQDEFKEFKWYLQNSGVLAGLMSISKSELENRDMLEVVDLMFGTYSKHCMEVTKRVLSAMKKKDLAKKLSDIS